MLWTAKGKEINYKTLQNIHFVTINQNHKFYLLFIAYGLGLFRFPSILYKVVDHKDIEIVKYIKSIQDPNVNC